MKYILTMLIFVVTLYSSTLFDMKKGWQLVGFPTEVTDLSIFTTNDVDILWIYNSEKKSWLGYSNHEGVMNLIKNSGFELITEIKRNQGVWVFNRRDWKINFDINEDIDLSSTSELVLNKGWNLTSLTLDTMASSKIFGECLVWKYDEASWLFNDVNETVSEFSDIRYVDGKDGIWVYCEEKTTLPLSEDLGKLINFSSTKSLTQYIDSMSEAYKNRKEQEIVSLSGSGGSSTVNIDDSSTVPSNTGGSTGTTDITETNLQENGVDESDILKHNGEYIFYVDEYNKKVYFTSFANLANGDYEAIGVITVNKNFDVYVYVYDSASINSMYIKEDLLVIFYRDYYEDLSYIKGYDISDIDNIHEVATYSFNGNIENSRIIDNYLYIIGAVTPTSSNEIALPELTLDNNKTVDLVSPEKFYAPLKMDQNPNIVTLLQFDMDNLAYKDSVSIVGNIDNVYASSSAIYAFSTEYGSFIDYWNYEKKTVIYKFNVGESFDYSSRGDIDGRTLDQFSFSEYDGYLRVGSIKGTSWGSDETDNLITVLKEENGHLLEVGKLTGLGKELETMRAVRFIEDKGFVVTFRETDPFYTIDLSNPEAPKKIGELEITGYSQYFHPIDEDRILSIGTNVDTAGNRTGAMVELFDISDFANPKLVDKVNVTESSYDRSEAQYNHKAFVYRESDKKFGFPVSEYGVDYYGNYLKLYSIDNLEIKTIGVVSSQATTEEHYRTSRGIIFTYEGNDYGAFFRGSNFIAKRLDEID